MQRCSDYRIKRILEISRWLSVDDPPSIDELVRMTKRSRRTVFRDLRLLADAGYKVGVQNVAHDEPRAHSPDFQSSLLPEEVEALAVSIQLLLKLRVLPDPDASRSAWNKLLMILPDQVRRLSEELEERVAIRPEPQVETGPSCDLFKSILHCLRFHRRLDLAYACENGKTIRRVLISPIRLIHVDRAWRIQGYVEEESRMELIPLHRIVRCRPRDGLAASATCSIEEFFGLAWRRRRGDRFHVMLKFDPIVAEEISEVYWHATQTFSWTTEGELLFEVELEGLDEIARWVLGFGPHVQILKPDRLRDMILHQIGQMAMNYGIQEASERLKKDISTEPQNISTRQLPT